MGEEVNRSVALRFSNVYGEGQPSNMLFLECLMAR